MFFASAVTVHCNSFRLFVVRHGTAVHSGLYESAVVIFVNTVYVVY